MDYDIYGDIAKRTDGDIYIGVVGPVRTGKSTFITKFMEQIALPNMSENKKSVAIDEMPQSADGKTVMTTEPKFIPAEAASVTVGNMAAKFRLVDCVGYMVDGALGAEEDGKPRLVSTPWQTSPMPFSEAAKLGTEKVVKEHSTIAVVVTADGSFTDIKREAYADKEKQVVNELKSANKPFIVIFNTSKPNDKLTKTTCESLEKQYGVAVVPVDVLNIKKQDIETILKKVLEEFPVRTVDIKIPYWIQSLPSDGKILSYTVDAVKNAVKDVEKMKDAKKLETMFDYSDVYEPIEDMTIDLSTGCVSIECKAKEGVFFMAVSEASGESIEKESDLMDYVNELTEAKRNYSKIKDALFDAESDGYGIVQADFDQSSVGEPEVCKKAGQYCVKMRVDSKSLHLIRADITQEVEPVYGSKEQCENFLAVMEKEGYNATVFGRPLSSIVEEEMFKKCANLPDNLRGKIKRVVTKAVNEKRTGLIYFLI